MGAAKDLPVLNPDVMIKENTMLTRANMGFPYERNLDGCYATDYIDTGLSGGKFLYYNPNDPTIHTETTNGYCGHAIICKDKRSNYTDYWNCRMNGSASSFDCGTSYKRYVRLNLSMSKLSECYAYNTATGDIYYAGKDTPYYGKTNIND
jgi:hypothetical protein